MKIVDIELKVLKKRAEEAGYKLSVTPAAKKFVADAGFDPSYGARPLKRAIMKYIEDPVSEFIISDRLLKKQNVLPTVIHVGLSPDKNDTTVY